MNVYWFKINTGEHAYHGYCEYVYSPGEKPDGVLPGEPEHVEVGKIDLNTVHELIEVHGQSSWVMVYPTGCEGHEYHVLQMRDSRTVMDELHEKCLENYHRERQSHD